MQDECEAVYKKGKIQMRHKLGFRIWSSEQRGTRDSLLLDKIFGSLDPHMEIKEWKRVKVCLWLLTRAFLVEVNGDQVGNETSRENSTGRTTGFSSPRSALARMKEAT